MEKDIKELIDDIPDDEVDDISEEPADYEIWIDADDDLHILADSGYIEEDEARLCYEFFLDRENILANYPEFAGRTCWVRLYMTAGEFTDLIEEKEIK